MGLHSTVATGISQADHPVTAVEDAPESISEALDASQKAGSDAPTAGGFHSHKGIRPHSRLRPAGSLQLKPPAGRGTPPPLSGEPTADKLHGSRDKTPTPLLLRQRDARPRPGDTASAASPQPSRGRAGRGATPLPCEGGKSREGREAQPSPAPAPGRLLRLRPPSRPLPARGWGGVRKAQARAPKLPSDAMLGSAPPAWPPAPRRCRPLPASYPSERAGDASPALHVRRSRPAPLSRRSKDSADSRRRNGPGRERERRVERAPPRDEALWRRRPPGTALRVALGGGA